MWQKELERRSRKRRAAAPRPSAPRSRLCWRASPRSSPSPTATRGGRAGTLERDEDTIFNNFWNGGPLEGRRERPGPHGLRAQVHLDRASAVERLAELPATFLPKIGPKTGRKLEPFGLRTCGDVARAPLSTLQKALGAGKLAADTQARARGQDPSPEGWALQRARKSVGAQCSYRSRCPRLVRSRSRRRRGRDADRSRRRRGWAAQTRRGHAAARDAETSVRDPADAPGTDLEPETPRTSRSSRRRWRLRPGSARAA